MQENRSNNQTIIIILLLVLLTALISAGIIYFILQSKINSLQKQVNTNSQFQTTLTPILTQSIVDNNMISPTTEIATTMSPTTTTPVISAEEGIKQALADKHSKNVDDVIVTVNKTKGNYASGGVKFSGEMGGGMWLAVYKDGEWIIAFDGNGTPYCSAIEPYNFPSEIVEECWDEDTGTLKTI